MSYTARLTDKKAQDFASKVGEIFKSVPHLPKSWVDFLVKIVPILALIGAVLSLFAGPVLGFLSVLSLLTLNPVLVLSVLVAAILSLVTACLLFLAYKPLKERKYDGWMFLFWCQILGAVQSLFHILFREQAITSLIGILVGFYILYEMRPRYK